MSGKIIIAPGATYNKMCEILEVLSEQDVRFTEKQQ